MAPLAFNQDGSFKIVQLADLHFTNEEGSCMDIPVNMECKGDLMTIEYIERLLDKEKPDLVVFTGDNIKGTGVNDARAATFKFVEPVIKRKIPWTAVFGNHDDGADLTRDELLEVMRRLPYSMVQQGPLDLPGVGNYMLNIFKSNQKQADPAFALYFLDSHGYAEDDQEGYDYIKLEQLDWLVHSSLRSSAGRLNAAAFFHIPIWEYHEESNTNRPVVKLGDARESVSSPAKNMSHSACPLMSHSSLYENSGHDHVNDYCLEREDIQLCYGGGAGVGGYGAEHLNWSRRARVFELNYQGETVSTWKRLFTQEMPMIHYQTLY
ncbi:Metallo-dependent phosphatase-like protein [Choanephora cucurbitarum]|nr:Metallo-dependent phosphatase-like protein [Choanephora cucurbitarum]